ncbi:MAG: tetratricopeptide repeat protein [Pseudomonadota bacterium]
MKFITRSLIVVSAFLTLFASAHAAPPAPAPLPPAAQEALNKGIIAAKVPDYLLAIRFFEEARKLAPQAPVLYLNLGLAESRIPGRELRAIAWFGAYLAAYPDAPNAAAVKEEIAVLVVKSQSNLSRLIKMVQDVASQIPEDDQMPTMGRDKGHILSEVSKLWAGIGDTAHAQKTAELIIGYAMWKDAAYLAIAEAQFKAGDIAGASQTAGRIQDKDKGIAIQKAITELAAKPQSVSQPVTGVSEWLYTLKGGCSSSTDFVCSNKGQLRTEPFLDLVGHLKSLPPPSKSIYEHFWALQETAEKIVKAQNVIIGMLKQQAGK